MDEEADESVFWLEYLRNCRLVTIEETDALLREATELSAIFTASAKTSRLREEARRAAKRRPPRRPRRRD